ncbi:MAG: hypothetical protein ACR2RV_07110 [Verrucomicrobiales bacterium]
MPSPTEYPQPSKLRAIAVLGGLGVVPGRRYRIASSPDLLPGSWQTVAEAPAAVAPATHTARSFVSGADSDRQFYRVEIVP